MDRVESSGFISNISSNDSDQLVVNEVVKKLEMKKIKVDEEMVEKNTSIDDMSNCYRSIIQHIGEDLNRQGLIKTPARAAKAMLYFTKGYDENLDGMFFYYLIEIIFFNIYFII